MIDAKGNFLIETLAVVAIIAFLALFSVPIFSKIKPRLELRTAARELAVDIRLCQQLAISEQVRHKIVFNEVGKNYQIIRLSDDRLVKSIEFKSAIEAAVVEPEDQTVVFNSSGAVDRPGKIILKNQASEIEIEIKSSGFVSIAE